MAPNLKSTSKFLSLILRHRPETIGLTLDEAGWVSIAKLLEAAVGHGKQIDHNLLLRLLDKLKTPRSRRGAFASWAAARPVSRRLCSLLRHVALV